MKKQTNNKSRLQAALLGIVFAIVLMSFSTSCCVTGYCQTSTTNKETQQKQKEQQK